MEKAVRPLSRHIWRKNAERPHSHSERSKSGWNSKYIGSGRKLSRSMCSAVLVRLISHSVLSAFEESSAACISDMLRQVSNGQYLEAIRMAEKFILHVEVLFATIDDLEYHFTRLRLKGESYREPSAITS